MTSSDPTGRHDWHSQTYVDEWITSATARDETRRKALRRVACLIPHASQSAIRVLDVGAGYGALSEQILARFSRAEVVCQDFSAPMFEHARQRLSWALGRVTFVVSDLSQPGWTSEFEAPFDAVVSAIAIHNVRYPERIRAIYEEIYQLVAPGGCFLNAELIFPPGHASAEAYARLDRFANWIAGDDDQSGGQSPGHQTADAAGQQSHHADSRHGAGGADMHVDRASLEQQLCWLREAGFEEVDCFWKEMRHAIIGGFRTT